jgi:hypothetical protein
MRTKLLSTLLLFSCSFIKIPKPTFVPQGCSIPSPPKSDNAGIHGRAHLMYYAEFPTGIKCKKGHWGSGLIPGRDNTFLSPPQHPDHLWGLYLVLHDTSSWHGAKLNIG